MLTEDQTFDTVQEAVDYRREQREQAATEEVEIETDEPVEEEIEAEVEETEVEEEISEGDPPEEVVDEASEEDSEVDDELEEAAPETPDVPAVEPPQHLKGEEREQFSKLTPDAQAIVTRLAKDGEAVVTKKAQELHQTRQLFEQRMEGLDGFISESEATLAHYDNNVDWPAAYAACKSAEDVAYVNGEKAKADDLRKRLTEAKNRRGEAEIAEHRTFVEQRTQNLTQLAESDDPIAKALVDTQEGVKRQRDVFAYMQKAGMEHDTLMWVPASGLTMAYKAMMYDRGNERAKELPTKRAHPKAKPAAKAVRATPSGVQGSSQRQRLQALRAKDVLTEAEFTEKRKLERKHRKK